MPRPAFFSFVLMGIVCAAGPLRAETFYRVTDEVLHEIDPRLFGQFMERPSWGEIGPEAALVPGTHRLQPQVVERIRRMNSPIFRFPGGTDVDYMDWRDMVSNVPGRSAERPVSIGHKGHEVTNNFGIDEFLRFCEGQDSAPILVVNLRDTLLQKKPLDEARRDAAGLVAYCNAERGADLPDGLPRWTEVRAKNGRAAPYKVKYWQIGNETWFFFKELNRTMPGRAERHYADCVLALAEAMLAVDPTIEFIVDGHGPTWNAAQIVKERLGRKVAFLAFHQYRPWGISQVTRSGRRVPPEDLSDAEVWRAWVATPEFDADGLAVLKHPLLDEARRRGLKLAMTEWNWNGWWQVRPRPLSSSFAKGVGAAGYLHAMMRSGDVLAVGCQSMLVGDGWGIHAVWADREGKRPPRYMPTGQATMLYSRYHGPRLLALESRGVPTYRQPFAMSGIRPQDKVAGLDALATAGDDAVYFHVINRQFDQAADVRVDLSAVGPLAMCATHHMLSGRLEDEPSPGQPEQIAEITDRPIAHEGNILVVRLPPRTVSSIEIPRRKQP